MSVIMDWRELVEVVVVDVAAWWKRMLWVRLVWVEVVVLELTYWPWRVFHCQRTGCEVHECCRY